MNYECFWLVLTETQGIMRRIDNGNEITLRNAPPGAMWEAPWMNDNPDSPAFRINGTGPVIVIRMPNGEDWMPGSQSSNCTLPNDPNHDCWAIHGEPPILTADKQPEPGRTVCNAGAGSIQMGPWHGFLRQGVLVEA